MNEYKLAPASVYNQLIIYVFNINLIRKTHLK